MIVEKVSSGDFNIVIGREDMRILCDCLNDVMGLGDDLIPRVGATPAEVERLWQVLSDAYDTGQADTEV